MVDAAEAFVVGEEEHFLLQDRATESATELILIEGQSAAADGLKEAGGVEHGVAEELPGLTVKLVCSALDSGIDDSAGGAAIFGAVVVGFHLEFGERIGIGLNDLVGKALVAGAVGVVVDAIQQEIVELAAATVHVIGSVAAAVGAVFQRGFRDPWGQQSEIRVGTAVQGEFDDLLRIDELTARTGFGLDQGSSTSDIDDFEACPTRRATSTRIIICCVSHF